MSNTIGAVHFSTLLLAKANLSSISIKDISKCEDFLSNYDIGRFLASVYPLCLLARAMSFQMGHFRFFLLRTNILALFCCAQWYSGHGHQATFRLTPKRNQRFVNSWLIPMKNWCWFVRCSLPTTFPYGQHCRLRQLHCVVGNDVRPCRPEMGIFGNVSNRCCNSNNKKNNASHTATHFMEVMLTIHKLNCATVRNLIGGDVLGNKWNNRNFVVIRHSQERHFVSLKSSQKQRKLSQRRAWYGY